MAVLSNNVKVSFAGFNFMERQRTHREQYATVRSFSYEFSRNINAYGKAYGGSSGGLVTLTIRTGAQYCFHEHYENLSMNEPRMFSFIYNAVYDDSDILSDYEGAMVISGYVVSMEETYDRYSADMEGDQMFLKMNILISKVSYMGVNNQLDMSFTM